MLVSLSLSIYSIAEAASLILRQLVWAHPYTLSDHERRIQGHVNTMRNHLSHCISVTKAICSDGKASKEAATAQRAITA